MRLFWGGPAPGRPPAKRPRGSSGAALGPVAIREGVRSLGFGVWGLGSGSGLGAWGLGFGVWGLALGAWGLGLGVRGSGFRAWVWAWGLGGLWCFGGVLGFGFWGFRVRGLGLRVFRRLATAWENESKIWVPGANRTRQQLTTTQFGKALRYIQAPTLKTTSIKTLTPQTPQPPNPQTLKTQGRPGHPKTARRNTRRLSFCPHCRVEASMLCP